MTQPVNLNKVRKERARAEKKARADENARRFGRSKSEKQHEKIERDIAVCHLDGHKTDK